ncbi:helix-turn-helix transcriptional regulator [Spirosoma sp. 209]|uniref:helix-turn-helix transcriptional regulator n=1 Tax=Spirosoma sp. 209 TaxID=1955701 RepID=UPI00098D1EAA|nr:helix-turn-helix transcriptional regulator [Spirosoma sp. 209]
MSQTHSFSVAVAEKLGLREAIFLNHFSFWHHQNRANKRHYFDGHYWTYNTVKSFNEQYPYLSPKEIWGVLDRLEKDGYIMTGNYNEKKMDRTKWYALTEKGCLLLSIPFSPEVKCISLYSKMDFTLWEIPFSPTGRAIPVTNTLLTNSKQITFSIRKKQKPRRTPLAVKSDKTAYRERVKLTEQEYTTLIEKHGQQITDLCLDKLDAYKLANGKKYASDYGAINQWVLTAVAEDQQRLNRGQRNNQPPPAQRAAPNPNAETYSDLRDPERVAALANARSNSPKSSTTQTLPF